MSRRQFYLYLSFAAVIIFAGGIGLQALLAGMPSFHTLEEYTPSLTTRVYDIRDETVAELSIERRALLTLGDIPVDLQNAVIAIEDDHFFQHWGISPRGILRAALRNMIHGRVVQGGSTLTQQLSKLIFLTPERKLIRKAREILLALQLERNLSKEEILQLYLNQVYFGHGAYGVQAAAQIYFGKDVSKLNLAECALLAGLIKYPGGYSPFQYPARARVRRSVVLSRMKEESFIKPEEEKAALAIDIPTQRPALSNVQAPFFVEHVKRQLEPRYGYNAVWRGGLKIYTTLDLQAQKQVEDGMTKALAEFDQKAFQDWEKKRADEQAAGTEPPVVSTSPPPPIQGAFILLDARTGAIRAMVGGRGDSQYNRATQAKRQPGSTFKPFVWAAALQSGMTGASLVEDAPLAYYFDGRDWRLLEGATDQYAINLATAPFAQSGDFRVWVPNNFDGKFMGVITLRKALALSRNMVSVRLIEHIGPPQVVALAHKMGIKAHLDPVLSLGLGGSVVTPLEMANAFATFANGGIYVESYDVQRVEDAAGKILERHIPQEREAISPQIAYLTTSLMKEVVEHGTAGAGPRSARRLRRPLAGKTGTTQDNRDLWFIGFTPDLVAAAWMGYDDFASLGRKDWTGGSTVVPWWTDIMEQILKDYPPREFPLPDQIAFSKIDGETGLLARPTCPKVVLQAFLKGTAPTQVCNVDHTKPLDLKASISRPSDIMSFPANATEQALQAGATLPMSIDPLPSDEELDRLSEHKDEIPIIR